jgi:hypothetical protein
MSIMLRDDRAGQARPRSPGERLASNAPEPALLPGPLRQAANLFTRNIWQEFFRPAATPAEETRVARLASLFMKVGRWASRGGTPALPGLRRRLTVTSHPARGAPLQ